jgi:predicted DNA-binding transcriptional regulator AlpA
MPRKKPVDLSQPLVPHFFYRRHSPIAKGVIGLADTQIDEKIKNGELPPLVKAFDSGRTVGWLGSQLIELQQQRLAKALATEVGTNVTEEEPTRERARATTNTVNKEITA